MLFLIMAQARASEAQHRFLRMRALPVADSNLAVSQLWSPLDLALQLGSWS
jgi:hypothetical protein